MLLIGSIMIKSLNILENVKKKKKINFQYFFTDKDFDDFDDTYDFEKEEIGYFKRDESVDKEDEEGGGGGGGGGNY